MVVASSRDLDLSDELRGVILDELNIKTMTLTDSADRLVTYKLKPQLKTLGPKYGKLLGGIRAFLDGCNGAEVVAAVKGGGTYKTEINGAEVEFAEEDLLISTESAEGYVSASDKGLTVAVDTRLTPALIDEGIEREIVSKVQNERKACGFEVTDHIRAYFAAEGDALRVLQARKDAIAKVVLADSVQAEAPAGEADGAEWDINGSKVFCRIEKV